MSTLLLHICCGPCAAPVIERLKGAYDLTGFFYNPNIHPLDEYLRRLEAAKTVAEQFKIPLIEGVYEPNVFFDIVRGLEDEPENGERCQVCYRLRLSKTVSAAAKGSFNAIASTLTTGTMKKASIINPIGKEESACAGIQFVSYDWKKKDGFKRSCELSREYGIYRQNYCGCLFSMRNTGHKK